jgi:hypothetical protein
MCYYAINGICYMILCPKNEDCGARDDRGYPNYAETDECTPKHIEELKVDEARGARRKTNEPATH